MKTRTITIAKSEIFFDVEAATHVFARAAETSNLRRADAVESDTGESTIEKMLTRYADRRVGELKERLSRFLSTPETAVTGSQVAISSATSYGFSLYVEDGFQDELLEPLADALESYIAHGVAADWYGAVGDAQANFFSQQLPRDYEHAVQYIVKRKFPTRV